MTCVKKTTLSQQAEPGHAILWTAASLPNGCTVRINDEAVTIADAGWSHGHGNFSTLASPLTGKYPVATVVTVIARKGECPHLEAVPVDLLRGGERVAWYCPGCEAQLPADWTALQKPA